MVADAEGQEHGARMMRADALYARYCVRPPRRRHDYNCRSMRAAAPRFLREVAAMA